MLIVLQQKWTAAHLLFSCFKELGQLGSRVLKGARVVSQLHGLNTAKLREQLFDNTLQHKQQGRNDTINKSSSPDSQPVIE